MAFCVVKALAAIFVIAQFSGTDAITTVIVIETYNPRFAALEADIRHSANHANKDVQNTIHHINANANEGQHAVDRVINHLRQEIEHERREAQRRGRRIQHCIDDANKSIQHLNRKAIDQCRDSKEIHQVKGKLHKLEHLFEEVRARRTRCIQRNLLALLLRRCFDHEIADARHHKAGSVHEINRGLHNANEHSANCVRHARDNVKDELMHAEVEFGRCVRRAH